MRPWMGAMAAAAAIAVLPASAFADDSSVYEFKLPNKATVDQLINLGFDVGDGVDQSQPGFVKATIVATSSEKAQLEAMGYPAVATIETPADVTALRAERQATIDAEGAAKAALNGSAAKQNKSAAVGTVRAQHADYWEDAGGRWLSIEGTTTQASVTGTAYSGPQLVASWYAADNSRIGTGNLSALLDPDVTPRAYLYHVTRFRLGDASTIGTPMPAYIRIAAPNGDVGAARGQEVGRQRRAAVRRRVPEGLHHALRGPAGGLREDHGAGRRVLEHREGLRPAEQDAGLPAQVADRHRHHHAVHRLDERSGGG